MRARRIIHGRNKVCAIRDGMGGIRDENGGIGDHDPRNRNQQFFEGSGTKICQAFGIKYQKFGYKNGISNENMYLVCVTFKNVGTPLRHRDP